MSLKNHVEDELNELQEHDLIYLEKVIQLRLKRFEQLKPRYAII